ncbi:MAG: septum formation initiator family protein [Candidatus Paceibacterota bacterium]|jgi:cell division protein FtsB
MRDFQEKRKWKRVLYSKGILFVLVVLLIIVAQATWKVFQKQHLAKDNAALVTRELADLEGRNTELSAQIDEMNTDRGVEDVIRDSYQVAKEGEQMVIVVDGHVDNNIEPLATTTWWGKIMNLFK